MQKIFGGVRKRYGFTLIELLVVMGIVTMLAVSIIGYNRNTDSQLALFRDQAVVIGAINHAKALAIEKFNRANACGYGVHFSEGSNNFTVFQDVKDPSVPRCRDAGGAYQGNVSYDVGEEIEAPLSVDSRFKFWLYDGSGTEHSDIDVVFIPPDPSVSSTAAGVPVNLPISIYVGKDMTSRSLVVVSSAGQITGK